MSKRLSHEAKIAAYNDAIDALRDLESESDGPQDRDARFWLADKLDREADRLEKKHQAKNPNRTDL